MLDLRARGNSSLEVSITSRPVTTNFNGKSTRDDSRFGLGSQTKYTSGASQQSKASRVLGTQLYPTTESFDSPVELGGVHFDRGVKTFAASGSC